ncbi:hypothetical protein A3H87_02015 [Candidatus Curtissbacteria bacterium RIFCSPLOWO2_02_FULL_42_37]|uniref:MtN3 and saliva related transmembrane protein n=1 Tax=Candidatus Curtissbacteria bacterium RIFCSPLOWO2_01_FULL_42_50 TaxID=1797730 RepID=A0A1F5H2G6_9BACT|nr:MAG: hypothetical protein A3E71_02655 [Candidatus Curtissbacteria bacterium RIFCSPHIGHO2_12_FULL_42_33]OGD98269.1 MAG: hypothetical protein A3B54_04095 [Candidatus Curtissbacteria bacterium RIFCSPLOWO2_01_FULL_42_50]OGE03468.1 MAG: hypothetical protein A3G16_02620 [Candidatus Curtissbacteria bacterium RIFCSPLOWO2_12_FULL_41_16]OGE10341.1 MAG: hypothetical protein A3H87_02015 [Candidatus Curtissbacteria bacterium RIFCSPLOWO2_02_FULL_42_37]
MSIMSIIGFDAAALGTIAFLPQVVKVLMSKETKDISLPTFLIVAATNFLWTIYGILRKDVPLTIANSVIFVSVLVILWAKIKYK